MFMLEDSDFESGAFWLTVLCSRIFIKDHGRG
jgi:hypothetical protein